MSISNAQQTEGVGASPTGTPPKRGDPAIEIVEAVMASVIETALGSRRRWAAKHWYPTVLAELDGTSLRPPSPSKFEARFAAERKRRRTLLLQASAEAAAGVGAAVGEEPIEVLPGAPAVGRKAFELAIRALVEWRSPAVGVVWGDYIDLSRKAGEPFVKLDVFRALVFSPYIVDGMRHDLMPDWWRKKLAR